MKRLDKTIFKAITYKKWQDDIEKSSKNFPVYNSSKGKYYADIVVELLLIQNGLCAYTERLLYNINELKALNWKDGKLKSPLPKVDGDLEHFDPKLKKKQGWLWSNFFMVDGKVNRKLKGRKKVDNILKPDEPNYDPYRLFEYDVDSHQYLPNSKKLTKPEQKRVIEMLLKLGINSSPTRDLRADKIDEILDFIELGSIEWKNIQPKQFPTAIEMTKRQMINIPNP